ncbi:MAG: Gfo/Idh/MocA family protein, partial [bacterium]
MDIVKTAIIGCGGIANAHIRGLKLLWENGIRTFEIGAVCDIDESKTKKMAEEISLFQGYTPNVYTDVERMLSSEGQILGVDICTVHKEHHSIAIKCLEAKKHVTIEKPLSITIRTAQQILDVADKNKCILQVAENYRRAPSERAINWAIKEGMIGNLRMLYWEDIFERLWYWGWRDHKELAGGGWTLDGGVHFADLFRYHIGEVEELYAFSRTYNPVRFRDKDLLIDPVEITVEDTTMTLLRFENGVLGNWVLTNSAPGKK